MAADGGGGRELLALIHQHLLRGGFARAARELQAQSGQKLLPSFSTSLEDIFTHWEKTPPNFKRRNVSDEEAAIPEKIRVPDPVSSSESSEKEEDEKEKAKAANVLVAGRGMGWRSKALVCHRDSNDDGLGSGVERGPCPAAGALLHAGVCVGVRNALTLLLCGSLLTVLSNKQQPNAPAAAPSPAKAQKLPGPGKLGHAAAVVAKVGQSKAPVMAKAPESSSSSSSSSESEEEEETPIVKAPAPRAELAAGAESSSEESSEDTSSEEELATPAIQAKPAVKTVQSNAAPVKSAPAAPVSLKNAVKQTALAASQAKPASTTVPGAAQPDDTSESSSSSDSEDEERPLVTQTKPPPKSSQAVPSPVKPTPAASLSVKAAPAKTLPLSQGKTAPKPTVPKQTKTSQGRTAAPTKPAESIKPVESTASSASEDEDLPVPISQKRLSDQPRPIPNLTQAAKAGQPEKAVVVSTLKSQVSESGSSDSSDSEEESPAAQRQPPQAVQTNSVPQPRNVKKAPALAPATAPPAVDSSDDSTEESDSEDEIVPPSQQNVQVTAVSSMVAAKANATPPSGKRTKASAVPAVSRVSESLSSDASEHNMLAGKDTHPSQAVPPTHAEDTSDSSSSSDSDEEEAPKQPSKPGSLQKPGGAQPGVTQPAHNSSSESSEEEEDAASQSLLTGYPVLSKTPVTPQAPKTVPPKPGGAVGPGKAGSAANSLAKGSLKAAPADSLSSDSSDSDTDDNQVAANHKAENNLPSGQEATEASNKEKVAGKTETSHGSLKASSLKKTLAMKENNVGAAGVQVTPASSHALLSIPQSQQPSSGTETEVITAANVPAVETVEGLEVKKKKKKEKKEKKEKEKKKPSSTADKAVKTPKSKDKENKKQKTSQKRKLTGEDGTVGQPKEKKQKGQANEEVPKKKKKKAD
ncbi:TCOF protein, partial [Pomatorhinus ruficollis]|nr:TCOF protein [Pomatorhinus ruficollis]